MEQTQKRIKKNWVSRVDMGVVRQVMLCLLGGIMGMSYLGDFHPIGIAYFAAVYRNKRTRLLLCIAVAAGIFYQGEILLSTKYILVLCMVAVIVGIIEGGKTTASKMSIAIVAGISVIILNIGNNMVVGGEGRLYLLALIEGLTVIALTSLMGKGIDYLTDISKNKTITNEIIISLMILGTAFIIGLAQFTTISYPIYSTIAILFILIFGYKYGIGAGAATGVILGSILTGIGLMELEIAVCLAIAGVVASIFGEIGRFGSAVTFLLTGYLLIGYGFEMTPSIQLIKAGLTAGVLFIAMPKNLLIKRNCIVRHSRNSRQHIIADKLELQTKESLKAAAHAFKRLGGLFRNLSEKRTRLSEEEINRLFDELANKVCSGCIKCKVCWKEEFLDTYRSAYTILGVAEKKGRIRQIDIPLDFIEKCDRIDEVVETINILYEVFKNNLVWNNKVCEGRELIYQQLVAVGEVVAGLGKGLDEKAEECKLIERRIERELSKENIRVSEIAVLKKREKYLWIYVVIENKANMQKQSQQIKKIIEAVADIKVELSENIEENTEGYVLCYEQVKAFSLISGVSRRNKGNNFCSGDNYTLQELESGQAIMALSDGMGSGEKACKESEAAIELLEQMIEAGFDKEVAIKLINSILVLKSHEQSFSTLDLSIIDLFSGKCEIVKAGAASTFIVKQDRIEVVNSTNLPIGILDEIQVDEVEIKLENEDMLIMVTDGIIGATGEGQYKIRETLEECKNRSPKVIAEEIIKRIVREEEAEDDMTVLVGRICSK